PAAGPRLPPHPAPAPPATVARGDHRRLGGALDVLHPRQLRRRPAADGEPDLGARVDIIAVYQEGHRLGAGHTAVLTVLTVLPYRAAGSRTRPIDRRRDRSRSYRAWPAIAP